MIDVLAHALRAAEDLPEAEQRALAEDILTRVTADRKRRLRAAVAALDAVPELAGVSGPLADVGRAFREGFVFRHDLDPEPQTRQSPPGGAG